MSRSLSTLQAVILGVVVLACLGVGAWALFQVGERQGMFAETFEVTVYVADAQDVDRGTTVRVKGVEAGQVVAVEYPEDDGEDAWVRLRLRLSGMFRDRLFADAKAAVVSKGFLGTSAVSVSPGTPRAGPLTTGVIRAEQTPDMAQLQTKLYSAAEKLDELLEDVRNSQGTLVKLLKEDDLYEDARKAVKTVNRNVEAVEGEISGLKDLVRSGRDAATSLRQNADAVKAMPIIRGYVDDPVSAVIRPNCTRDRQLFAEGDLFEPNKAVLTERGRELLTHASNWLNSNRAKDSEVVVATFADPKNPYLTYPGAKKLTEKQSEVVAEFLKERGVHKISFWSRRNVTPVGFGADPSPVVERDPLPAAHTQIMLFVPQS